MTIGSSFHCAPPILRHSLLWRCDWSSSVSYLTDPITNSSNISNVSKKPPGILYHASCILTTPSPIAQHNMKCPLHFEGTSIRPLGAPTTAIALLAHWQLPSSSGTCSTVYHTTPHDPCVYMWVDGVSFTGQEVVSILPPPGRRVLLYHPHRQETEERCCLALTVYPSLYLFIIYVYIYIFLNVYLMYIVDSTHKGRGGGRRGEGVGCQRIIITPLPLQNIDNHPINRPSPPSTHRGNVQLD